MSKCKCTTSAFLAKWIKKRKNVKKIVEEATAEGVTWWTPHNSPRPTYHCQNRLVKCHASCLLPPAQSPILPLLQPPVELVIQTDTHGSLTSWQKIRSTLFFKLTIVRSNVCMYSLYKLMFTLFQLLVNKNMFEWWTFAMYFLVPPKINDV